ncbi:MAG: bifunctional diguanylate cyclase/phosphodiesterase, partial [Campylobacterota bacterium]|nr:bifunctional diguanylate cyclase/phosphodiesterase [Campylobacterota bacterium]
MTLLYVDDQKDCLLGLLSRYFDDIISIEADDIDVSMYHKYEFCCVVINLKNIDPLPVVVDIRHQFPASVISVVLHEDIDVKTCIGIGIEHFILYPYDEEQIDILFNKLISQQEYAAGVEKDERRDHVTSLLNAEVLHAKIREQTSHATLLLIDIDNFDLVNTLYGMETGDKVLTKVAGFLHKMTPSNCALHRLDADEFVIYMDDPVQGQEDIVSKQIKSFFELTHFKVGNVDFNLRVSIGIATGDAHKIFHHAKIALKEAKANGRNSIVYYRENSPFLKKQRETLYWINEVKSALEEDRIEAFFQPILCNRTQKIVKYEALCRIESSSKEILTPDQFLDAALLGGLVTNVTRDMIDKAFKAFSGTDYDFSINVTRKDFQEEYILSFLKRKCHFYNIVPSRVFIEIVESVSFDVADGYLDQIQTLSEHGFKLAIDDFGTERSNYSRFLNIEADYLKIDGRFINNIDQNSNSRIIVESIVEFAKKIGAQTIAKYVNSPSVYEIVKEVGVDFS